MLRWIAVFLIFALCATAADAQTARKLLLMGNNCPLQFGVRSAPQCPTVVVPNNTVYQTDVVVIIGTGFSTALDGLLTSASNAGARRQSIIGTVLIFIGLILALSGPSAYMGGQC